jgi:hypothetical protein
MEGGMELWAIVPELILASLLLVLLPLGPFLAPARKGIATWIALVGLAAAAAASVRMLSWPSQPVFLDTYAVDPFAAPTPWSASPSMTVALPKEHSSCSCSRPLPAL